jgi:hypothetical protein
VSATAAAQDGEMAARVPCAACATPRIGPYCHACGQASTDAPRSFGEVLTGQSGKVVYTLRNLLLHPGELAREIDEGRDRRAMRPLTLLLNLVAIFFVLGGGPHGFSAHAFLSSGPDPAIDALHIQRGAPGSAERARFDERLEHRFQSFYSLLVVVQTLAYGVGIAFLERRKRKPWLVHFAAATHYMCVSVLVATLAFGGARLLHVDMAHQLPLGLLMYAIVITYMTLMLRRAFDDPLRWAIPKALGLAAYGYVVAMVLSLLALGLALVTA